MNTYLIGCLVISTTIVSVLSFKSINEVIGIDSVEYATTDNLTILEVNGANDNELVDTTMQTTEYFTTVIFSTETQETSIDITTPFAVSTSTTAEVSCPSGLHPNNGFCYAIIQAAFPYECPYKDVVKHAGLFSSKKVWQFVKRNVAYGYYEHLSPFESYQLFQEDVSNANSKENCIVYDYEKSSFLTENCSRVNEAQCGYSSSLNHARDYCKAHSEICDTTKTCWCNSIDIYSQYTCQIDCVLNTEAICVECKVNFTCYQKVKIQLDYNGAAVIAIRVTYPMKLADLDGTNSELQCFTDAQEVTIYSIYTQIFPSVISADKTRKLFQINLNHQVGVFVGRYWCEAYVYPNLEKVSSNTVIAGLFSYPLCFVVNITVSASDYTFLPYNAHTSVANLLHKRLNEHVVISLVEIFPLYDDKHIKMAFRLSLSNSTVARPIDLEREYEGLKKLLQNVTVQIRNCAICISNVTHWNGEEIHWPNANIGQAAAPKELLVQEDGLPLIRKCLGTFTYGAYWSEPPKPRSLGKPSSITQALHDLVNSTKKADEKNELLAEILQDVSGAIPYDVYLIATVFDQIIQSREDFDLEKFVANVNQVATVDSMTLSKAQEHMNATDMILYGLDFALGAYSNLPVKNIKGKYVLAQTVDLRRTKINGLAVYNKGGKLVAENLEDVQSIENLRLNDLQIAVFLPSKLIDYIEETSVHTNRLVSTMFTGADLFNGVGNLTNFGGVLGVYVSNCISSLLPQPFPVIFRRDGSLKSKDVYCGHWRYGIDDVQVSILGRWRIDVLPEQIDDDYFLCYYDHMTHFALLMGAPNDEVLNIVSIVGCVLSFIGISTILISGVFFKKWRRSASVKVLLNFSGALLGQMVFLFVSSFVKSDERNWLCSVVAVGLHYFMISQFCWMLMISYLQYKKFVHSLVGQMKHLLLSACLLGWGFPLLPVIIMVVIDTNSYDYNCYLTGIYLQLGIMLPAMCIIAINVIMFVKIFFTLSRNKTRAYGEKDRMTLVKIKWGVVLYFLTGFSWIFGLLANLLDSLVLSYLFCITSTIQGMVLCVNFCVLNENFKKMWMKRTSPKKVDTRQATSTQNK